MIHIIAAMGRNNVIGNKNKIPWKIPQDLERFKKLTMGHWIVMGRKTYESIGRPLPGRTNVVITRKLSGIKDDSKIVIVNSLDAILSFKAGETIFIIGGGEVYQQAMKHADMLHITLIGKDFPGDTYFPEINPDEWELIEQLAGNPGGDTHPELYWWYQTYRRKNKTTSV